MEKHTISIKDIIGFEKDIEIASYKDKSLILHIRLTERTMVYDPVVSSLFIISKGKVNYYNTVVEAVEEYNNI